MTHTVEVHYGDGTPVEGQGYTTSKTHTSGRVELDIKGRKIIVDTFDLFRGNNDVATCITFPDTLDRLAGKRVEHFDNAHIEIITIVESGKTALVGVPDKSNPTAPPIGIYVTRL